MMEADVPLPGIVAIVVPEFENEARGMLYRVGRFLQLFGLLIIPTGIAGNLADRDAVGESTMFKILGVGIAVFALGWLLARSGKPS
jgi:hypothetical protein